MYGKGHELQIKVWILSVLDTNNQKFNEIWWISHFSQLHWEYSRYKEREIKHFQNIDLYY